MWRYSEQLGPGNPVAQMTPDFRRTYLQRAETAALEQGYLIRHDSRRMAYDDGTLSATPYADHDSFDPAWRA